MRRNLKCNYHAAIISNKFNNYSFISFIYSPYLSFSDYLNDVIFLLVYSNQDQARSLVTFSYYVSKVSYSANVFFHILLFFFLISDFLEKAVHLSSRGFHILDLARCFLVVLLNNCSIPYVSCSLFSRTGSILRFRSKF